MALLLNASEEGNAARQERMAAKPWYLRDTPLPGGITIPVSPVTLLIGIFALVNLLRGLTKRSWAIASHILIPNHDNATKEKLQDYAKIIKNDAVTFASFAVKYSSCPSEAKGGNLGKFHRGDMAPPFDRAVFDPNSPLLQTIGPIETQFGWHLIYIHKRVIVD